MKSHLKDYFSFSKSERIGIIILISIIMFLILLPQVVKVNRNLTPIKTTDELYKVEVEAFMKGIDERQSKEKDTWNGSWNNSYNYAKNSRWNNATTLGHTKKARFTPFRFDPNTATQEDWIKMGFSERQAAVILKYRNKGGHFSRKEDFGKLYIVDAETYNIFEPYITIHDSFQKESFNVNPTYKTNQAVNNKRKVELNSADSIELLRINGVGPVFASRILKYRKKLGGFATTEQVTEVYGMDSIRFSGIADQITVDTLLIKEIDVNTSSLTDLRKHPYLDYYSAKALIDKRVQLGGFSHLMEIQSALAGKPGLFRKIRPYIKIS